MDYGNDQRSEIIPKINAYDIGTKLLFSSSTSGQTYRLTRQYKHNHTTYIHKLYTFSIE